MKKANVLFTIWGIIVIMIVILLTVLGFMIKNIKSDYRLLEDDLLKAAQKYTATNFVYPDEGRTIKVSKNEIEKAGFLEKELKIDDDVCNGYVEVKTDKAVSYKAYIKCRKYQTEGYEAE